MEFIASIHSKNPLLVFEGYLYREHSTLKNGTKRYRCTKEKTCKSFALLTGCEFKLVSEHNHMPEPEKIEAKKVMNTIKGRAISAMQKPGQIHQLFTIHCNIYGSLIPTMFALLPNKTQTCYSQLFALLSYLRPKTIITDFEVAITNAAEYNFSDVERYDSVNITTHLNGVAFNIHNFSWTFVSFCFMISVFCELIFIFLFFFKVKNKMRGKGGPTL